MEPLAAGLDSAGNAVDVSEVLNMALFRSCSLICAALVYLLTFSTALAQEDQDSSVTIIGSLTYDSANNVIGFRECRWREVFIVGRSPIVAAIFREAKAKKAIHHIGEQSELVYTEFAAQVFRDRSECMHKPYSGCVTLTK